jgi:hypothetical protein
MDGRGTLLKVRTGIRALASKTVTEKKGLYQNAKMGIDEYGDTPAVSYSKD